MRMTPPPPRDPGGRMNTSTLREEFVAGIEAERAREQAKAADRRQAEAEATERHREQVEDTLGAMFDALDADHALTEPDDDHGTETPATFAADLEQAMRDHQADN